MPELPEVHGFQKFIESTSLNQKIVALDCRDNRLLKQPYSEFQKHLIGEKFTGSERIGKYLFLKTSGKKILLIHFGMTGRPNYYKEKEARPKFAHIVLTFENRFHFAFENKRKFGRWDLVDSIEEYRKKQKLSKDARDLTFEEFKTSVKKKKLQSKK